MRGSIPLPGEKSGKLSTAAVLLQAADLILRYGWCQDSYRHGQRLCLFGAICETKPPEPKVPLWKVEQVLGVNAITWNDADGRTQTEVVAALDAAAVVALQEEGIEPEEFFGKPGLKVRSGLHSGGVDCNHVRTPLVVR